MHAATVPASPHSTAKEKKIANKSTPPWISCISGAVAGGCEAATTYPFEFVKTRLQLKNASSASNPLSIIRQTVAQEGVRALYVGCSTLVMGTALKAGVRFMSFDRLKSALADDKGRLTVSQSVSAGMMAGIVESVTAVTPTERIKTAMIDDAKGARRFHSSLHAMRILVREQGFCDLYKGLAATTLKQCATSGVRMGSYNTLKQRLEAYGLQESNIATFLTGGIAGTITVYATQPFDAIKSRTQSVRGARTFEAARAIICDSGVRGFWKGSTMRLGRLVFSGGIVFTIYENISAIFQGFYN